MKSPLRKKDASIDITIRKMATDSEVRCPYCGKLLLKGGFVAGSWIDLRCPNAKCIYHKNKLVFWFNNTNNKQHRVSEKTDKQTTSRNENERYPAKGD